MDLRCPDVAATMRAARLVGPGCIEVVDAPLPHPGPGEVRVKLEGCGVCASNLGPWAGPEWMQFPTEAGSLGHEGWGRIDAIGDGVCGLRVGDPVAALSQHAYAQYDVAPSDAVVKLPAVLADRPFPGEPLGCAMNIFRRSCVRPGDTVAVVGAGFMGLMLIQLCAHAGARVIAVSRRPYSLALAAKAGASHVIPLHDHYAIIGEIGRLTDGRLCDVVIEAIGQQWPLDLAAEITRERGRLVVAGYHQDGPRQVNMQMWNWRGLDVINAHERDPAVYVAGIGEAVEACLSGRLDPFPYLTHRYSLERLGEALNATRDRPDGFLKAVVVFS